MTAGFYLSPFIFFLPGLAAYLGHDILVYPCSEEDNRYTKPLQFSGNGTDTLVGGTPLLVV